MTFCHVILLGGLSRVFLNRPGADDVLVLQQELVRTQTLMDLMSQDREKEKEQHEKELSEVREKYRMYVKY
jgi:hypothetical protein